MQTSNFRRAPNDPNALAITRGIARGWRGRIDRRLAPSWKMLQEFRETEQLHGTKTAELDYPVAFSSILAQLDAGTVYHELGEDAVLLCYEELGQFWHRRLVAEWFKLKLGVTVSKI